MKICHLCTGYALSFQGGITNCVRALAESHQKSGHDVWAVSGDPKQTYIYQVLPYESEKITPMTFCALKDKAGLNSLKAFFQEHNFDLIHIHMILDVDWDLAEVLKPYRYVVSLHDYFYLCPRVVMLNPGNPHCTQYNEDRCRHCVSLINTIYITNGIERRIRMLGWKNFHLPFIPQKLTAKRFAKFKKLLENAQLLMQVDSSQLDVSQIQEHAADLYQPLTMQSQLDRLPKKEIL